MSRGSTGAASFAKPLLAVALVLVGAPVQHAAAAPRAYPYECGNPAVSGAGTSLITATDANLVAQVAVGHRSLDECPYCVCDPSRDGQVTATDVLIILGYATGATNEPLTCSSGIVDGTDQDLICTPCTDEGVFGKLQYGLTGALGGEILDTGSWILFACPDNTTIRIDSHSWDSNPATGAIDGVNIAPDDVVLSGNILGHDRGITFELAPACYSRCLGTCEGVCSAAGESAGAPCAVDDDCAPGGICRGKNRIGDACTESADCNNGRCAGAGAADLDTPVFCTGDAECFERGDGVCYGPPDRCPGAVPDIEGGARFLTASGNNFQINDFTVRGFFDGIHLDAADGLVRDVDLERQCDDSITNDHGGIRNTVRRGTISRGCDKCTQDIAGPAIEWICGDDLDECCEPDADDCYHITYEDVEFEGCSRPLRVAGVAADAGIKMRVSGATMVPLGDGDVVWACKGPRISATEGRAVFSAVGIDGCEEGMTVGGSSIVDIVDSSISNGRLVGVLAVNESVVDVRRSIIMGNGWCDEPPCLGSTATTLLGGVGVADDAVVTLTGDKTGGEGNKICGNRLEGGEAREVNNDRPVSVAARGNWWCNGGGGCPEPDPGGDQLADTIGTGCVLGHRGEVDDADALTADPFTVNETGGAPGP